MTTPVTTLDQRYSGDTAVAVPWEQTRKLLEAAELFWLCTVRPDGRPHATPVVAAWADDAIHFHTGDFEQKFANIRANPHVLLITGCNTWDQGVDVMVEGDAVQVTDETTLQRLAGAWATKWDERWQLSATTGGFRNRSMDGFVSQVFTVRPTRIYAHAKGDPFGHTRHLFAL
jgi:nitroimidazol reductase NimA-like FMN-containing flavoprotein (pyridoxamine 5'-phosphate oxidase superfamily)